MVNIIANLKHAPEVFSLQREMGYTFFKALIITITFIFSGGYSEEY